MFYNMLMGLLDGVFRDRRKSVEQIPLELKPGEDSVVQPQIAETVDDQRKSALSIVPAKTRALGRDFVEVYGNMHRGDRILNYDSKARVWIFDPEFFGEIAHLTSIMQKKTEFRFEHNGAVIVIAGVIGKKLPSGFTVRVDFPAVKGGAKSASIHNYFSLNPADARKMNDSSVFVAGWQPLNGVFNEEREKFIDGLDFDFLRRSILGR